LIPKKRKSGDIILPSYKAQSSFNTKLWKMIYMGSAGASFNGQMNLACGEGKGRRRRCIQLQSQKKKP
jgi:hypothetical protein